jgi:GNAT superfamily N-acetyltransferase
MSRIQIILFDPESASRETWAAFHTWRRAESDPDVRVCTDGKWEEGMRQTDAFWDVRHWLALEGPDVAGYVRVSFRRAGSPNAEEHARFLGCSGTVVAHARRRGIGTLLLRQVCDLMHALDKSVLTLSADTDAGHAFLTRFGATAKHTMLSCQARLDDLDWPRLRAWEDMAGDIGLVFECYAGRVPRDVLVSFLPAFTAIGADMPLESLESPPFRVEIGAYDQWYKRLEQTEAAHHLVLLRDPAGTVVGMSEAFWNSPTPKLAFQQFTAVARSWRGRGLGRAIKAALLRQIRSTHPCVEKVRTANGESNAAMLAVNRSIGYTVLQREVDYQVTRADLDAGLQATRNPSGFAFG